MNRAVKLRKPRRRGMYKGIVKIGKYLYVYMPSHPNAISKKRYVALHRLIFEWKMNLKLPKGFVVHHFNGDTLDNQPQNLIGMTAKEHNKITAKNRNKDKYGKFK